MNEKIEKLREKLKSMNMQGMIITNPISIRYLTKIDSEGVLLLTRRENVFITDGRYIERVNNTITIDDEIIVYDVKELIKEDYENFFTFCVNIGFEETHLTYAKYKEYMHKYKVNNFEETEGLIERFRIIKQEDEIECIKKACLITDECFDHIKEFIKIGMTEKEVAYEIEKFFMTHGADGLAFDTIVASGVNTSMPHAVPTDKKIEDGDPITIDMGCKYKGYCSDMTRTIFMGCILEEIKPVYDLVLKNQKNVLEEMIDCLNPGGRLSVISFHSLEDRIVKNTFIENTTGCVCPKYFPICVCGHKPKVRYVDKKFVVPSKDEINKNSRSTSSKLRIVEKI